MLYSIIPVEVVFGSNKHMEECKYIEVEYEGEKVEVTPLSGSTYRVNRLISTSPRAYLNPRLMPGSIIEKAL